MPTLSALLKTSEERSPGPSPAYSKVHALLVFITIGTKGTIGRGALAHSTGLGQGSIRTILKKFEKEGFVAIDAQGCRLTTPGKRLYAATLKRMYSFVPIKRSALTVGPSQIAVLVRPSFAEVGSGISQRDSAVFAGANGATTYMMKGGKFSIPGGSNDCEKDYPSPAWSTLRKEFGPKNGDAIIVCGAANETTAKLGALSAALTLL